MMSDGLTDVVTVSHGDRSRLYAYRKDQLNPHLPTEIAAMEKNAER